MILRTWSLAITLALTFIGRAAAQPVSPESLPQGFIIIVQDKSGQSKAESPLYLASNWNGWSPGDAASKLTTRSDMRWQIILKPPAKDAPPLEFKITRGSWEQCEVAGDLADIPNRTLAKIDASKLTPGEQPRIEIVVEKFSDQRPEAQAKKASDPYHTINATGTVRRLTVVGGGAPGLVRDCLVWLPPGYDDPKFATRRYSVLYMQDGQNLFEQAPGTPGEWQIDETITRMSAGNRYDTPIVVGIPHAGPGRISEYLPVKGIGQVQPRGDAYVDFLINEVIPRVNRTFRTKLRPENTAIGGSSMGGLISLYAAYKRPDVFGKVLAESPSLAFGDRQLWKDIFTPMRAWPGKIYLGVGGQEAGKNEAANTAYVNAVKALDAEFIALGASGPLHKLVVDPKAGHDETAWAQRFPAAFQFLFDFDAQ